MKTGLAAAMAALATLAIAGHAFADGDAAEGAKIFRKCKTCHMIGDNAQNRVGPELNGIVGRPIASAPGYSYSSAFEAKKKEGFTWTEEHLEAFLKDPMKDIPGTKMPFAGLKQADERDDLIAYLKQFK